VILLVLACAWLLGLGLAAAGLDHAYLLGAPLGLGPALGFAWMRRPAPCLLIVASTVLFVLGSLRLEGARPSTNPDGVALFNDGSRLLVRGVVDQEPEERGASQRLVLRVESLDAGDAWQATSGKVLVTLRPFPKFAYGDRLELNGRLETPPSFDTFDYREYLARRGIVSMAAFPQVRRLARGQGNGVTAGVIYVRDHLGDSLSAALPEPEAALGRGMLLGQRTSIPATVTDDFNRAGISHLIAISGSNVTIVAELVVSSLAWIIGRRRAVLAAMLFIGAFVLLVGASPSVVRAAVMGVMMLGAVLAGRPGSALPAVAFAAAVLTAWQPLAAFDVAFQLSFAATLGLILLQPRLDGRLAPALGRVFPGGLSSLLSENISITTAASLAVFPITAANFQRVSLVAIPANIVAVPLFTATILLSGVASVAGLVSSGLGDLGGRFAVVPLWALIKIAHGFAALPYASAGIGGAGLIGAGATYAAMGAVLVWLSRPPILTLDLPRIRLGPVAPAAALIALVALLTWWSLLKGGAGLLQVSFLDVGQGDALLITTPSGQRILVDGGPSGPELVRNMAAALPPGARTIDLVVLTQPQSQEATGLVDVLERFDVKNVALGGVQGETAAVRAWLQAAKDRRIPVTLLSVGQTADLGAGVRIDVVAPDAAYTSGNTGNAADNPIALRLSYGSVSFLLASGLGQDGQSRLLSGYGDLHSTVLKVPLHGSDGSSSDAFLSAVRPSLAVISADDRAASGGPSPTTLLRLAGIPIYRTDRNGAVRFETDGRHLYVNPDRGAYQLVPISVSR
jgi:competence protein ComEC